MAERLDLEVIRAKWRQYADAHDGEYQYQMITAYLQDVPALLVEVERLRKALRPFASQLTMDSEQPDGNTVLLLNTWGDLRRARDVLKGKP